MDFAKAFSYMFKSKNWYLTMLIGILICVPNCIIIYMRNQLTPPQNDLAYIQIIILMLAGIPITFFTSTLISGYTFVNAHQRVLKPDVEILQWTNFKEIILTGFKCWGAGLIYIFPFIIISTAGFIFYMIASFESNSMQNLTLFTYLYLTLGMFLSLLFSCIITPAFITNLKFKSYFNFKLMFNLLKNNPKGFGILVFYTIIVGATAVGMTKLLNGSIYMIVINPILAFYFAVVQSEILAQYIRGAAEKQK